mmetsp:Transcript_15922/g.28009  ORF Transcript_15922/g.28009 Transcript_15922/m.28009 type:complete len:216 (-) Transcript_15922:1656-2303(-)
MLICLNKVYLLLSLGASGRLRTLHRTVRQRSVLRSLWLRILMKLLLLPLQCFLFILLRRCGRGSCFHLRLELLFLHGLLLLVDVMQQLCDRDLAVLVAVQQTEQLHHALFGGRVLLHDLADELLHVVVRDLSVVVAVQHAQLVAQHLLRAVDLHLQLVHHRADHGLHPRDALVLRLILLHLGDFVFAAIRRGSVLSGSGRCCGGCSCFAVRGGNR